MCNLTRNLITSGHTGNSLQQDSRKIRDSLVTSWNTYLHNSSILSRPDELCGSSPPSVFVGSYGYPQVGIGPLVAPDQGDTSLLDAPERWTTKTLAEIIKYRLKLVRGVRYMRADVPSGRYIESLQEMSMATKPTNADLTFEGPVLLPDIFDDSVVPFGSVGRIKSASFSNMNSNHALEKMYNDYDMDAREAILLLYNTGIDVGCIQKCLSIGMFGKSRKLVPTRWSITAVDSIISDSLRTSSIMNTSMIDSWRVYCSMHLGNIYSVILYPHMWHYEMIEAWHGKDGTLGFSSDSENHNGMKHPPAIAGAYFAARLGVCEYLARSKICAGVLVLREIRPEYSVPVGVWQVREGIRDAMRGSYECVSNIDDALKIASAATSTSATEWLCHGNTVQALRQKTLSEFV